MSLCRGDTAPRIHTDLWHCTSWDGWTTVLFEPVLFLVFSILPCQQEHGRKHSWARLCIHVWVYIQKRLSNGIAGFCSTRLNFKTPSSCPLKFLCHFTFSSHLWEHFFLCPSSTTNSSFSRNDSYLTVGCPLAIFCLKSTFHLISLASFAPGFSPTSEGPLPRSCCLLVLSLFAFSPSLTSCGSSVQLHSVLF